MTPFLTFYTPTYRRPTHLAACLESVRTQTIAGALEQIVIPDHVGLGIGGMFQQIQRYAGAVHGQYVHILADDDVLAGPTVAADVRACAEAAGYPPVILVSACKGGATYPSRAEAWPPVCGSIDLGCIVTRADVWAAHVHQYGDRYEGDYDFMAAVAAAGHAAVRWDGLFLVGGVSHGHPEGLA